MNPEQLIALHLARPFTHAVVTTYRDGTTKTHKTRGLSQADTFAALQRRKLGRDLLDRDTGKTVRITSVTVEAA